MDHFIAACKEESDVVVFSGDFLPDPIQLGFSPSGILRQEMFLLDNKARIWEALDSRPFIYCQGNHDWINLDHLFYEKSYELKNTTLSLLEVNWHGFPNTPTLSFWNHYTENFTLVFERIPKFADILVSHCPPKDILDEMYTGEHVGIEDLREQIENTSIRLCMFGHIHEANGMIQIGKIRYSNAARSWRVIEFNSE